MLNPTDFAPTIVFTLFTLVLLFYRAWRIIVKQEKLTINDILILGLLIGICHQLFILSIFHSLPETINFCDHYKLENTKKECVPIDEFTISAPFLRNLDITDNLTAKIYDETGEKVDDVNLYVLNANNDPRLIITLPDDVQQKLIKLLKNNKHLFYLDIFIKDHLWKVIPFKLEE